MPDLRKATVASAAFEYQAIFLRPIFAAWQQSRQLVQPLFEALGQWGVTIADLTVSDAMDANAQIEIRVPSQRMSIALSLGQLRAEATNPTWEQAETIVAAITAAKNAVVEHARPVLSYQAATLLLHLLPPDREPPGQLLRKLANPGAAEGFDQEPIAWGFGVYGAKGYRVIDVSRAVPGALYVGLSRLFWDPESTAEVAALLRKEQVQVLAFLGLTLE